MLTASVACKRAILDAAGQFHVVLDRLDQLTVPTLVVWGALDKVVPLVQARAAADRIAGARLEILRTCGHVPHVECPETLLPPVLRFLHDTREAT
jgi:pimeloyl-ACP methyl ester carboxylesterase